MKTTKSFILSVVTLFVATFALSSCLNDDNDYKVPTKEEQASYQKLMAGTYGSVVRFYYQNYNNAVKYDSIKHYSWNVTADSTITMRDFPVCKLDSAIFIPKNDNSTRAQELAALRTAIHESQSTVEKFTSKYFVPNTSYQHQYGYKFAVYPKTIKQSFVYNGKAHDVYFIFDLAGYIGTYASNSFVDKIFEYNMVLSGICVDEYKESNLISDIYFRQVLMTCTTK